jgi:1,4-alpha-glucan branching enzyme
MSSSSWHLEEAARVRWGRGTELRAWQHLGPVWIEGASPQAVRFAVWAPNARAVSVVGDFNGWDAARHPLTAHDGGVWEGIVSGVQEGQAYKFQVTGVDGTVSLRADPMARQAEQPPRTASLIPVRAPYVWKDAAWMSRRRASGRDARPLCIYEVHLGSWRRTVDGQWLTYRELAEQLVPYACDLGVTHLELLPVMEHPFYGSWGYQVTGFFAPTARYGAPDDLRAFIDACHQAGLGVLLDWVPAHFPGDEYALARFDGTALYEHADPRQGEHPDWGTRIFNYGRSEVQSFLLSNALYWIEEFHVDGLRVDAVASMLYLDYSRAPGQWIPNRDGGRENLEAVAFLQQLHRVLQHEHPDVITCAEESTVWPGVTRAVDDGGLGFSFKWNMGWMHDVLDYLGRDPVHRRWHHRQLTFPMLYAYTERFVLPLSHDEVVHGKRSLLSRMPGDAWQQRASLRLLLALQYVHPGRPLFFMGAELGQWREWTHEGALDWALLEEAAHRGLHRWVRDLTHCYRASPALWAADDRPEGFQWITCDDAEQGVVALMRRDPASGTLMVAVLNFTPVVRDAYAIGVPVAGRYRECLNSDAVEYGGSGVGHGGRVETEPHEAHGFAQRLILRVPPLAMLLLEPEMVPTHGR